MSDNMIHVLDKGYVRLVDHMGDDLTVVNSARVSYEKEVRPKFWECVRCKDEDGRAVAFADYWFDDKPPYCLECGGPVRARVEEKDLRLIRFLAEHQHTSPFRHCYAQFEIRAPLFVARQWWRHVVGTSTVEEGTNWNESSRRYVTEEPEFYIPTPREWRSAPENKKQGSGEPVPGSVGRLMTWMMNDLVDRSMLFYKRALELGVAPEQARIFLPAYAMYVRWRWTASLHAIIHFLKLREAEDAQAEIREYARAVHKLVKPLWPQALEAWGL